MLVDFFPGSLTLHGQHSSALAKQRHRPPGQFVEWCDCPGRHGVELSELRPDHFVFGTPADHVDRHHQFRHRFLKEVSASKQRFDERDAEVRASQRQRYAWQSRATADICDTFPGLEEFGDCRAVQYVAVPQPVQFPWADEPSLDAGAREDGRVLLGAV